MIHLLSKVTRGFIVAVFGLMFGDEGKGKAILDLIIRDGFTVNIRWQGGGNAGHSLSLGNGRTFVTHLIPSGCVLPGILLLLGNDMVGDPTKLKDEILGVEKFTGHSILNRLFISRNFSLTTPYHRVFDRANEWLAKNPIGTTGSGIGTTYGDKALRKGLRMGQIMNKGKFDDLFLEFIHFQQSMLKAYIALGFEINEDEQTKINQELKEWIKSIDWIRENLTIVDMQEKVEELLAKGEKILAEGAQGIMLDINEGDYPFVTSSMTGPAGLFSGLGCGPKDVKKYYGIMKPYVTKVGGGDFPSQMVKWHEDLFQVEGNEKGATTGRKRMCGYPDMVLLRHAINMFANFGKLHIIMTKCDCYPSELVNEPMFMITHYLYDGDNKATKHLRFPLSDVKDTIKVQVECWKVPFGTTVWSHQIGMDLFIRQMRDELHDLETEDLYTIEMIGTGPQVTQHYEYAFPS